MAASVATALDPAVREDAQSEPTTEQMPMRHEPEEIGAALALVSVAKETISDTTAADAEQREEVEVSGALSEQQALGGVVTESDNASVESANGESAVVETPAVDEPMEEAAEIVTKPVATGSAPSALLVVAPEGKTSRPVTPTSAKSKKAENALGIATSKKKKKAKKKKPEAFHPCVGLYINALDKKRLWGNARIIEVDVANEKIKITFPGFGKQWDLWTDLLSIAPHGSECKPSKGLTLNSWDGLTDLFTGERMAEADACTSPETQVKQEVVIAPSKPQRAIKKGYKLEVIPESEAGKPVLKSAQSSKRKLPAARESLVANTNESPAQAAPANTKRPRVQVKTTSGQSPKTAASPKIVASAANALSSDPELARQRQENSAAMDASAAFLSRCVDVWKKQFLSLTEPQQPELLSGETPAYVDL